MKKHERKILKPLNPSEKFSILKRLAEPITGVQHENVLAHGIDVSRRIIYLHKDVSQKEASRAIKHLRYLDAYSGDIIIDISSEGGDVQAGLMLIDAIRFSNNRVIGLVSGSCESMAFVVLQACALRVAFPWTTLSYHQGTRQGSVVSYDESIKQAQYDKEQSDLIDRFVHSRGRAKEPFSEFQINVLKSMYMKAGVALDQGWLDEVVRK